jgi:hypothetical protein
LKVVLDTCVLKLATFPDRNNVSAFVFELIRSRLIEAWASPAILEEYGDVLGDDPEFVAEIVESCRVCYPNCASSGTNQIIDSSSVPLRLTPTTSSL